VYVPGLVTDKFEEVLPPVHKYVPPPVATSEILVVVQVRTLLLALILVVGVKKSSVIVILAVASQPFEPVTIRVYEFAVEMLIVAAVPMTPFPSCHEYVPPPVPVRLIVGVEQVRTVVTGFVISAFGCIIS
jgi:hypothetical protein